MKASVFIIFIVLQAITCEKAVSKLRKKLMVPKMNEECKKIKCPSVEEPLCVKIPRQDLGRNMHIVVANRCELDYMKCHDDVEAKIVRMKYCGHNAAQKVEKMKNKMRKHIRVKRRVAGTMSNNNYTHMSKTVKPSRHAQESDNKTKLFELYRARLNRKKLVRMQRNNFISNVISKTSVLNDVNRLKMKHGADLHGRQNPGHYFISSETDSDWEHNERLKIKKAGTRGNKTYKTQLNGVVEIHEEQPQLTSQLDDFDMFSGEFTNTSNDMEDYDSSCPTVCPSRDVMVCGRNQHGIYQTFLSICDMKMFSCNHQDEVLELISRYPCVLSAPYLSEEGIKPKGRIHEEGDDDEILRFLHCQEKGGGLVKDLNGKLSCASSLLKDPAEGYKPGDRYFYFPGDGDNTLHLVDAMEPIDYKFIQKLTTNAAYNGYWLYTRYNPTNAQIIRFGDASSVAQSNFNFSKATVFLAHGWKGHGENEMNRILTEAFLQDGDVNVIVLDWSGLAKSFYVTAKSGTAAVGRELGRFVNWLVSLGASYKRIHLVGFSLGAHLVGNAGRETRGLVRRITALDPASILWIYDDDRVVRTDAQYVEVIHTNTFLYGYSDPCGDVDFFPNGGSEMPGCFWSSCSHSRAYKYMASSVKNKHLLAKKCADLSEATATTHCRCTGELKYMGLSQLSKSGSGIFRVDTGETYPY